MARPCMSKTYSPYLNQWDTSPDTFYDIQLSPIMPGDFNNDQVVDAADYVVWRDGLGSTYSKADYDGWKAHFGETAGMGKFRRLGRSRTAQHAVASGRRDGPWFAPPGFSPHSMACVSQHEHHETDLFN